jgi:hypothetical protein
MLHVMPVGLVFTFWPAGQEKEAAQVPFWLQHVVALLAVVKTVSALAESQ